MYWKERVWKEGKVSKFIFSAFFIFETVRGDANKQRGFPKWKINTQVKKMSGSWKQFYKVAKNFILPLYFPSFIVILVVIVIFSISCIYIFFSRWVFVEHLEIAVELAA